MTLTTPRWKTPLILVAAALLSAACHHTGAQPPHPNQINAFDGAAYDTLITVQAALEEAKTHIAQYPQLKSQLNQAITSYNETMAAYKIYHSAASSDPDKQAAIQADIQTLIAGVADLQRSFGVKLKEAKP